jgi:hypothetical protein
MKPNVIDPLDTSKLVINPPNRDNQSAGMVEVEAGGKKFMVTPEVATAMKQEKEAIKTDYEKRMEKLAQQQLQHQQPQQKQPEPQRVKLGERLFEDPDGALEDFRKTIKEEIRSEYLAERQAEKQRQQQETGLKEFYNDFFKENKELKDDRELVETILMSNFNRWANLTPDEVKKRLAEKAQETILRHTKANLTPESGLVLESGGGTPAPRMPERKPDADEDGPKSLSQVIKLRRKARNDMTGLKTPKA